MSKLKLCFLPCKYPRYDLKEKLKNELEKREMNNLKGGTCSNACSCPYAGIQCPSGDSYYGGASITANGQANVRQMMNY